LRLLGQLVFGLERLFERGYLLEEIRALRFWPTRGSTAGAMRAETPDFLRLVLVRPPELIVQVVVAEDMAAADSPSLAPFEYTYKSFLRGQAYPEDIFEPKG
jgi:hypothetical protein